MSSTTTGRPGWRQFEASEKVAILGVVLVTFVGLTGLVFLYFVFPRTPDVWRDIWYVYIGMPFAVTALIAVAVYLYLQAQWLAASRERTK